MFAGNDAVMERSIGRRFPSTGVFTTVLPIPRGDDKLEKLTFVLSDETVIHATLASSPSSSSTSPLRTKILLIHGLGSNRKTFDELIFHLMKTCDVCSFDIRMHGDNYQMQSKTKTKVLNIETFADDVMELTNLLSARCGQDNNWKNPLLVGHSYGGNIALEVGKKYPKLPSGIVLIDGGYIDLQNCFEGNWENCEQMCRPPNQNIALNDFVPSLRAYYPLCSHLALNGLMESFYLDVDSNCYRMKVSPELYMEVIEDLWRCNPSERYSGENTINCNVMMLPSGKDVFFSKDKELDITRLSSAIGSDGDAEKVRIWWFEENNHDVHAENAFGCAKAILENMDFLMLRASGSGSG